MKRRVGTRVRAAWCAVVMAAIGGHLAADMSRLPAGWASADIGRASFAGSTTGSDGVFVITGGGIGIAGVADGFQFAYRRLSGDGEIVVNVASIERVHSGTRAGVMMRDALTDTAAHASILLNAWGGISFERRGAVRSDGLEGVREDAATTATASKVGVTTARGASQISARSISRRASATVSASRERTDRRSSAGSESLSTPVGGDAHAPYFVKLVRAGDVFRAYASNDSVNWTFVGSETIPMHSTIYVGLAVTSGLAGRPATATFTGARVNEAGAVKSASSGNVRVSSSPAPAQAPAPATPPAAQAPSPSPAPAPQPAPAAASQPAPAPASQPAPAPAPQPAAAPAPQPAPAPAPQPPAPAPPPSSSGSATTLRVLHWNTRHGGIGTDGVFDPDRLVSWVARINPDVISFNEVDDAAQAAMLHGLVNAYTGITWTSTFSGWGNQILTRLPVNGSSVCSFNPGAGRLAAHLSTTRNGRTINIWSAHLAVESASARVSEIYALNDCAQQWSEARIIAGDFNMQQSSGEYGVAAGIYTDAWAAARAAGTAVNYSGNCDGCTRNSRIDYVFSSHGASFLTVSSVQIFDTRDGNGNMPSDHKPMLVTYTVR